MPLGLIILLASIMGVFFTIFYNIRMGKSIQLKDKKSILNISVFIFSSISLWISLNTFMNLSRYVDTVYGASIPAILGGEFWLYMSWLKFLLLGIVCIISGISMFSKRN